MSDQDDKQAEVEAEAAETTAVESEAPEVEGEAAAAEEPTADTRPASPDEGTGTDEATETDAEESDDEPAEEPAATADKPAAAPKPAPARERRPVDPNVVVRAHAKYVRTSARKARLVCDHIRGKSVVEARAILAHTPRAVAEDWSKLLESAVANAEHNHELLGEDLRIVAVSADEGPTLKRFRPRAQGRASRIRKRTSHLSIALTPKEQ